MEGSVCYLIGGNTSHAVQVAMLYGLFLTGRNYVWHNRTCMHISTILVFRLLLAVIYLSIIASYVHA